MCGKEWKNKEEKLSYMGEYKNTASHFTVLAKPLGNHLSIVNITDHKG